MCRGVKPLAPGLAFGSLMISLNETAMLSALMMDLINVVFWLFPVQRVKMVKMALTEKLSI